jgi:hypothetical protein
VAKVSLHACDDASARKASLFLGLKASSYLDVPEELPPPSSPDDQPKASDIVHSLLYADAWLTKLDCLRRHYHSHYHDPNHAAVPATIIIATATTRATVAAAALQIALAI